MEPQPSPEIKPDQDPVHEEHLKKNVYPIARHVLLVTLVVLGLSIIVFLMYHNGKSIYDNGL